MRRYDGVHDPVRGGRRGHHWAIVLAWRQIRAYVDERQAAPTDANDVGNDSAALRLLPTEQYMSVMKSTPSLMEMTRNPFVLRLFVEVLPSMVAAGTSLQRITRYSLYKAFVTQWFTREVARKSAGDQASLGVVDGDASVVVDMFELLCALLALEMLKANVLAVKASVLSVASGDGGVDSVIWRDVQDAADEWLSTDPTATAVLQQRYNALSRREKARCAECDIVQFFSCILVEASREAH